MSDIPWFKVDDSFHAHPKVTLIPRRERASVIGLWCLAGSWCAQQLTDGHLGAHMLEEFGSTKRAAERLVEVGLWVRTDTGYAFHEWTQWQPTREAVHARRDAETQRKAEWRARQAEKRRSAASVPDASQRDSNGTDAGQVRDETRTSGGTDAHVRSTRPDPTRPDPTTTPSELLGGVGESPEDKPTRRKPETPIPYDWQPTDKHRTDFPRIDVDYEARRFRSWHEAKDSRYRNWNSAFTNWLEKADSRTQLRAVPDSQPDVPWMERARALMPILGKGFITREDLDEYERQHGTVQVATR